ncbi:unnamed protein product [Rotaria magnacalcarata]|uniref:Uncharacterized protein n=1 Tax=Rotaria magnacalcarata TaxID=392030 RepID=A0A8S2U7P5_9BILA|nr:unnamed protein product [Rotaria magnacalcarata]
MKFYGKDTNKKTIQLGQIGKIHRNQIHNLEHGSSINFIHELEIIKISPIEILVLLEQNIDHYLTGEIQQIKELKIDQKKCCANNTSEHRCIARVKLASPYFCSGTGTLHWQQFKQHHSLSMWHKLVKKEEEKRRRRRTCL